MKIIVELLMEMVFGVVCLLGFFGGLFVWVFLFVCLNTRRYQTFSSDRIWEEVV